MDAFWQTVAVVSAICVGIFALSIFWTLLAWLNRWVTRSGSDKSIESHGFLKKGATITIHLTGGEKLERLKFLGFTRWGKENLPAGIPFHLARMIVLENETTAKLYVRAELIQYIEEIVPAS